jgi:hypothetical protein
VTAPARLAAALLAAAAALAATPAHATRIEGQLARHGGEAIRDPIDVQLFSYASGWQPLQETKTDASGHFAFADLQAPGAYWVAPRFQDIQYPGEVIEVQPGEQSATKSVNLSLYDHTDAGPAVTMPGLAIIVEPEDAGVFRVVQEVYFDNPEPVVIARKPGVGQPVARIGVAPGHTTPAVRLYPALPMEFKENGDQIELYGPIFPSQQVARIEYTLTGSGTATERSLDMELVLAETVGEVRLLLPPAGYTADAPGLHPGPMERAEDTGALRHLTFRGFNLPAGTRIPLHLAARATPAPQSEAMTVLMVLLLLGSGAAVVLQPALASAKFGAPAPAPVGGSAEKEALYAALRDLEDDYAQGKVSDEDRERMRQELRQEALDTIARSRQPAEPVPSVAAPAAAAAASGGTRRERFCTACGYEHQGVARFCGGCGRTLA